MNALTVAIWGTVGLAFVLGLGFAAILWKAHDFMGAAFGVTAALAAMWILFRMEE